MEKLVEKYEKHLITYSDEDVKKLLIVNAKISAGFIPEQRFEKEVIVAEITKKKTIKFRVELINPIPITTDKKATKTLKSQLVEASLEQNIQPVYKS